MGTRKIELMHKLFGAAEGQKCKDCCHFLTGRYHDRIYHKCEVYGLTHSDASDWRNGFQACGLFNQLTDRNNIIRLAERDTVPREPDEPIPGQMDLLGG